MLDSDHQVQPGKTSHTLPDIGIRPHVMEEEESSRFESIIASAEISMGSSVHRLAVPGLPPDVANKEYDTVPSLLRHKFVALAACADRSVRLLSLPLDPPRSNVAFSATSAPKKHDCQDVTVAGSRQLRTIPRCIALTFSREDNKRPAASRQTEPSSDSLEDQMVEDTSMLDSDDKPQWNFMIAAHSAEPSNTLLICQVPMLESNDGGTLDGHSTGEVLTLHLSTPAVSLEFHPSRYPSRHHTELLVAELNGTVRILDLSGPIKSLSSEQPQSLLPECHHRWLVTLFAPFQTQPKGRADASNPHAERSTPLDAKWALEGKCIIVVFADGRWGLWDIGGAGPVQRIESSPVSSGSVSGGGITRFSLQGRLGRVDSTQIGGSELALSGQRGSSHRANTSESRKLAPMTPNTRRAKRDALFSSSASESESPANAMGHQALPSKLVEGGVIVSPVSVEDSSRRDDVVVFWFGAELFVISSLNAYWRQSMESSMQRLSVSSGGVVDAYGPPLTQVSSLSTGGERITSVQHLSLDPHLRVPVRSDHDLQSDILVSAEHRLVFYCPPKPKARPAEQLRGLFISDSARPSEGTNGTSARQVDDVLLKRGELDLGDIDRILDTGLQSDDEEEGSPTRFRRRNGNASLSAEPSGKRQRVGFLQGPGR